MTSLFNMYLYTHLLWAFVTAVHQRHYRARFTSFPLDNPSSFFLFHGEIKSISPRVCLSILQCHPLYPFYHLIAAADSNHDPRLCRFFKKNFFSSFLFLRKFPVFQQDDVIGYFENEHHECNFTTMFKSFSIFLSSTCPHAFFLFF